MILEFSLEKSVSHVSCLLSGTDISMCDLFGHPFSLSVTTVTKHICCSNDLGGRPYSCVLTGTQKKIISTYF